MKKIFCILICFTLWHLGISQTIELTTNGYVSKFKKIDTLYYSEYPLASLTHSNAKKEDFSSVNLKHAFGVISKVRPDNLTDIPSFSTNYYVYQDGTLQALTRQLFFKPSDISAFKKAYGDLGFIEEHSIFKGFYYLYLNARNYTTGESIFELCEQLFNAKAVSIIEPVFIRHIKPENPLRPFEWNIRNTGNVPGGLIAADMKVENAWCYSTGTNIEVAIIDDGVDLTHPDLQANLLPGYDATGNNSGGAPTSNNGHGTNCAGIIASVNNTIGTIGVAYNSRIIPLRMGIVDIGGFFNTNDTWIANCFNEAVNRGADVISNSWGGGSSSVQINLAIQNAVTGGRNGLGCVVLFSAGNNNAAVSYPAYLPEVIAVGASTPCDTRKRSSSDPALVNPGVSTDPEGTSCDGEFWWGSNFGTNLDIIAPGVWITTTDNVGANGIVSGEL
ncbi:MAG: S8 family serine peptidase [Bacteroidota bacterium]